MMARASLEAKALARSACRAQFESYVKLNKKEGAAEAVGVKIQQIEDYAPEARRYMIASRRHSCPSRSPDRQAILPDIHRRGSSTSGWRRCVRPDEKSEISVLQVEKRIRTPRPRGRWRRPSASIFSTSR